MREVFANATSLHRMSSASPIHKLRYISSAVLRLQMGVYLCHLRLKNFMWDSMFEKLASPRRWGKNVAPRTIGWRCMASLPKPLNTHSKTRELLMTQTANIDTLFIPITNEKSSHKEAPSVPATTLICTYQRPSQGVIFGDIRGNSAGFADFCRQFLARDVAIGPLLHFRGKIQGKDLWDL